MPSPAPCRRISRSPTAGTSWRTPAAASSTPCASRCVRFARSLARPLLIRRSSRRLSASSTKVTCGGKRRTRPSARSRKQAFQFARSAGVWATAARWCVQSCAASARTSSGPARARSKPICPGSTPSGTLAAATPPNSGKRRRCRAFEDRSAWLGNGRRATGARSRPTSSGFSVCRRREPWRGC